MNINILNCVEVGLHILLLSQIIMNRRSRMRFRRWWTQVHLTENARQLHGAYNMFRYFKLHNHKEFYKFVGLTMPQFDNLLHLVRRRLTKRSRRPALSPELRLAVVLNFLACGADVTQSSRFFRIGRSTMYKLIPEVCQVIYDVLHERYLAFPKRDDWLSIANGIFNKFSFPNCIGCIDGKHIRIKAPVHSGSWFFNYKKFNSIVLMAACDAYGRFTWINVGDFGSLNDSSVFQSSDFGRALESNEVDLPEPTMIPNTNIRCPFYFIGDGGFPLRNYLLKPHVRTRMMTLDQRIFNIRLSHARKIIECAFGILCKRWRIFESAIDFNLRTTEIIVMSTICLHNLIITEDLTADEALSNSDDDNNSDNNDEDVNVAHDNDNLINDDNAYDDDIYDGSENNSDPNMDDNEHDNLESDESSDENDSSDESNADDDNLEGEGIRRILQSYFVLPAGNVEWQWHKL